MPVCLVRKRGPNLITLCFRNVSADNDESPGSLHNLPTFTGKSCCIQHNYKELRCRTAVGRMGLSSRGTQPIKEMENSKPKPRE